MTLPSARNLARSVCALRHRRWLRWQGLQIGHTPTTKQKRVLLPAAKTAAERSAAPWPGCNDQEQPLVEPQVLHFMQVPLRTRVKLPQAPQLSPSKPFIRASATRRACALPRRACLDDRAASRVATCALTGLPAEADLRFHAGADFRIRVRPSSCRCRASTFLAWKCAAPLEPACLGAAPPLTTAICLRWPRR